MSIHFSNIPATFINIPKTGTTSFKTWCVENQLDCDIVRDVDNPNLMQHLTKEQMVDRWHNLGTTFTFVRNPFDRVVSMFHHLGQTAEVRLKLRLIEDRPAFKVIPIESDIRLLSVYRRGFADWVLSSEPRNTNCPLLYALTAMREQSQLRFLSHTIPDIAIPIENVAEQFSILQILLRCNTPFIHVNKSTHKHYREYYNDKTRRVVSKWFEDDLETFKYQF